ncbi:MAG: hypothetical protein II566_02425 [Lachnospiraceae bacterium]|nr:hypothetical protein [Lachnospiraceae bacterium]MBQ2576102.1 hypothetical protein [Lachnospiraceae bacterium]
MTEEIKYKEKYEKFLAYEKENHEKNQRKIRTGLKVNILLPLVFLIISFATDSSKLIFLILWITSLFGIAFYLIYVEYTDFRMQKLLGTMEEEKALIGDQAVQLEAAVSEQIEITHEKIEDAREAAKQKISELTKDRAMEKESEEEDHE